MSSIFKISLKHMHKVKDIPGVRQNVEGAATQRERSLASFNAEM